MMTSTTMALKNPSGGDCRLPAVTRHGHRKHLRPEKNCDRSSGAYLHNFVSSVDMSANKVKERITNGAVIVDQSSQLTDTVLQGVRISCFVSGGEKRLCLPEVMSTALQRVPMIDIERACNRLKIHNQHCSPAQVYALQLNKILPLTTTSCGLITQANAERLCHYLLKRNSGRPFKKLDGRHLEEDSGCDVLSQSSCKSAPGISGNYSKQESKVPVVHNCSGTVQGVAFVSLYKSPNAECIQCAECLLLFSPSDFVCHGHREEIQPENAGPHVCHWGLDSNKWRLYLNVDKGVLSRSLDEGSKRCDQTLVDKLAIKLWEKQLNEFKKMFADVNKVPGVGNSSDSGKLQPGLRHSNVQLETKVSYQPAIEKATTYSSLAATTLALSNPGAVAMEVGFDSLIRVAKQISSVDETVQNAMIDEIVKLRLICQHSTSFLFQTNSLLSHSVDQLARENFALKRDYERLAESCVSKVIDVNTGLQYGCSKPTRRKLAATSDSSTELKNKNPINAEPHQNPSL